MKKVKSNQAPISINSCTKLSKMHFFPVSIVKRHNQYVLSLMLCYSHVTLFLQKARLGCLAGFSMHLYYDTSLQISNICFFKKIKVLHFYIGQRKVFKNSKQKLFTLYDPVA